MINQKRLAVSEDIAGTGGGVDSLRQQIETLREGATMNRFRNKLRQQQGKVGWILLWLLGIPIPILLVLFLLRGCT